MKMYIRVSRDKFRLPVDFDYDPRELAKRQHVKTKTILQAVSKYKRGRNTAFIMVELEDEK